MALALYKSLTYLLTYLPHSIGVATT